MHCSFHFFHLNSLTHLSSGGQDPASSHSPSPSRSPSLKPFPFSQAQGHSSFWKCLPKRPFPSLLEFPSPCSDLYQFCLTLSRMLDKFLKDKDHILCDKA